MKESRNECIKKFRNQLTVCPITKLSHWHIITLKY